MPCIMHIMRGIMLFYFFLMFFIKTLNNKVLFFYLSQKNKKNCLKRAAGKKHFFGTCKPAIRKPANCGFIYQCARFIQVTVSCSLQQHKDAKSLENST